jgi:hypothetical protein
MPALGTIMKSALFTLVVSLLTSLQVAWSTSSMREADIEGNKVRFEYSLTATANGYRASMLVKDAARRELWSHSWNMDKADLQQMMSEAERSSVKDWTQRFFDNRPFTNDMFERKQLTAPDLREQYLAPHAKALKVSVAELRAAILQPKVNFVFNYCSEWREALHQMVFVPKYGRFVEFSGYPGDE